jgi:ABC-type uncharacterized transport system permease subunit
MVKEYNRKLISGMFMGSAAGIFTTIFISYTKISELYFNGILVAIIMYSIGFYYALD